MRYSFFFFLFLGFLSPQQSCAQAAKDSGFRYNAVYLELGGPAMLYSVGYERTLYHNRRFSAVASVGGGGFPGVTLLYAEPDALLHLGNFALEAGVAISHYQENFRDGGQAFSVFIVPRLGARYYSPNRRWHFRMGITPIIEVSSNEPAFNPDNQSWIQQKVSPWANVLTVGYRF